MKKLDADVYRRGYMNGLLRAAELVAKSRTPNTSESNYVDGQNSALAMCEDMLRSHAETILLPDLVEKS